MAKKRTTQRRKNTNWKSTRPMFNGNTRRAFNSTPPAKPSLLPKEMTQKEWNAAAILGVAAVLFNFALQGTQARVILVSGGVFWILFCLFHVVRLLTGLVLGVSLSALAFYKAATVIRSSKPDLFSIGFSFAIFTYGLYLTVRFAKRLFPYLVELRKRFNDEQTGNHDSKPSVNNLCQDLRANTETNDCTESNKKFAFFLTKENAEKDAAAILDSANKCAEIINHTNDSKAYFTALGQLLDGLLKLSGYEKFGFYKHSTPTDDLTEILKPENLRDNTDKFITRSMIRCAKEISEKHSEDEKRTHYKQFAENLREAFRNANSYWSGNENAPHYTGQLFTDENMAKVENLCNDEESGYRAVLALTSEISPQNPHLVSVTYDDPLFLSAMEIVLETGQASTSILQRRLKLGYSRASHLINEMEHKGYVGPFEGSRPRQLLITREQWRSVRATLHYGSPAILTGAAQIIHDEENWRRERMGLSPIEYELQKVDGMEGHAFEEWCADLLKRNGFCSVKVTPGSGDQGVDITAAKDGLTYAVQCKRYASDLGNTPIQEVVAGKAFYHCNVAAVMTNQHFTSGAKELASVNGVLLWDRETIIAMLKSENPSLEAR